MTIKLLITLFLFITMAIVTVVQCPRWAKDSSIGQIHFILSRSLQWCIDNGLCSRWPQTFHHPQIASPTCHATLFSSSTRTWNSIPSTTIPIKTIAVADQSKQVFISWSSFRFFTVGQHNQTDTRLGFLKSDVFVLFIRNCQARTETWLHRGLNRSWWEVRPAAKASPQTRNHVQSTTPMLHERRSPSLFWLVAVAAVATALVVCTVPTCHQFPNSSWSQSALWYKLFNCKLKIICISRSYLSKTIDVHSWYK